MKKIIVKMDPFIMDQTIEILEDNKFIESVKVVLPNIPNTVAALNDYHKVDQILFFTFGSIDFANKYVNELKSNFDNLPPIVVYSQ